MNPPDDLLRENRANLSILQDLDFNSLPRGDRSAARVVSVLCRGCAMPVPGAAIVGGPWYQQV